MRPTEQDVHPHLHALSGNAAPGGEWMSIANTDCEKATPQRAAYSVDETAELLGCCSASIYRALRRGDLESVMLGGRRLIPARSLERLLTAKAA
jgi:excisionase family DNA binding protein